MSANYISPGAPCIFQTISAPSIRRHVQIASRLGVSRCVCTSTQASRRGDQSRDGRRVAEQTLTQVSERNRNRDTSVGAARSAHVLRPVNFVVEECTRVVRVCTTAARPFRDTYFVSGGREIRAWNIQKDPRYVSRFFEFICVDGFLFRGLRV